MAGLALGLAWILSSSTAFAGSYYGKRMKSDFVTDAGIGFTLGPDTFLLSLGGDYILNRRFSVGPLLQIGLSDAVTFVAPTANFKSIFDLPNRGFARRVKPFVQGGMGMIYANTDGGGDDLGFMFNFGFGADVYITPRFALGNHMMFNVIPTDVVGETLIFSWQFVSARYHF